MAVIKVVNCKGEEVSQVDLPDDVFNVPVKSNVIHEVVNMQLASKRSGTASAKRRSDVKGSRRKMYRQKGTGRARKGDIKSPLLRGGGVVFGPSPRSYARKVSKKIKKSALKMVLSDKFQNDRILVLDRFDLDQIKTRDFVSIMDTLEQKNALIVIDKKDVTLELSSRNVPNFKVLRNEGLNVVDILKHEHLILLEPSIQGIERRLLK